MQMQSEKFPMVDRWEVSGCSEEFLTDPFDLSQMKSTSFGHGVGLGPWVDAKCDKI